MRFIKRSKATGLNMTKIEAAFDDVRQKLEAERSRLSALEAEAGDLALAAIAEGPEATVIWEQHSAAIDASKAAVAKLQAAFDAAQRRVDAEAMARTVAETKGQRERVKAILSKRTQHATALSNAIAEAVKSFRALLAESDRALIAWPGRSPAGVALTSGEIVELVKTELYRLGGVPALGGAPIGRPGPAFPGGRAPDLRTAGMPESLKSIADAFAEANAAAVRALDGEPMPTPKAAETPPTPAAESPPVPSKAGSAKSALRTASEIQAEIRPRTLSV